MKTATITDARKNLGKWLQAAARGEDIGIISGADVIALRRVEVESADYAWREYGLVQAEVTAYERAAEAQHERLRAEGQVEHLTADDLRQLGRQLFECRGNRDLRFLFLNLEDCLEVTFLGNHDEIRQEIQRGRLDSPSPRNGTGP